MGNWCLLVRVSVWDDDNWGTSNNCDNTVAATHNAVCGAGMEYSTSYTPSKCALRLSYNPNPETINSIHALQNLYEAAEHGQWASHMHVNCDVTERYTNKQDERLCWEPAAGHGHIHRRLAPAQMRTQPGAEAGRS